MPERFLFTSESVTEGHPDKVADQISDTILDAILAQDPEGRVAVECLVNTGLCVIAGEITTSCYVDMNELVRAKIMDIGYTDAKLGFNGNDCAVLLSIDKQSADISQGVTETEKKEMGAGDQGLMFGYAINHTKDLMPLPVHLAHGLTKRLSQVRRKKILPFLGPDGKAQVTVEFDGDKPKRIDAIVISNQHCVTTKNKEINQGIREEVINKVIPAKMIDKDTKFYINPTGRFVVGGPHGDCGLTGRKIIVDTYGGWSRHGGGAFSGKDPSKVDRSAAYMARYIAKNIVAAKLAGRCEVQLAYAIGVADPVSVNVNTFGTGKIEESRIEKLIRAHFGLKPHEIIQHLQLKRPIYAQTAVNGHFGANTKKLPWEQTDKAAILADEL